MGRLKFVLASRGLRNVFARTRTVSSRFGLGPGKMARCLRAYMDVLDRFGVRPTFPITALPMSRNLAPVRMLLERGAELAVHAHTHVDLSALSFSKQLGNLRRANETFGRCGIPFTGFRAPYLHWNQETMRCVEELGYLYSSNEVLLWDAYEEGELDPGQRTALERAAAFYRPERAEARPSLPHTVRGGFVEIPVSLPDDEIPVDRLGILEGEKLTAPWSRIFDRVLERGELFTIQLHPERIFLCREALEEVLSRARGVRTVWLATLEEVARWWKGRTSLEFALEGSPDGDSFVRLTGPEGSTLWVRDGSGWNRPSGPVRIRSGASPPCLGVAPGSDPAAVRFLREDGFWVEEVPEGSPCALHLGSIPSFGWGDAHALLDRIGASPAPLVRAGRWPGGRSAAVCVTGDIDCLTLGDFALRLVGA